ncbi:hypothetical protein Y695_03630 [Hydrogenophaga sp. T4]|nr:hypothetical protein Y695_03630 [Hydrogenophaga sp. T4]
MISVSRASDFSLFCTTSLDHLSNSGMAVESPGTVLIESTSWRPRRVIWACSALAPSTWLSTLSAASPVRRAM